MRGEPDIHITEGVPNVSSREVDEAVGEAPTAAGQLDAKQVALAEAEADLARAETRMDVTAVARLRAIVVTLRGFVRQLEATAAVARATEARAEAVALAAELQRRYDDKLAKLMPDVDQARDAIKAMTKAVRKCLATWHAAARAKYEGELLAMRFGLPAPDAGTLPANPVDAVTSMFWENLNSLDHLTRQDGLPTFPTPASDTVEQRTARGMLAAAEHVASNGRDLKLSADLLELFAKAGPVPVAAPARTPEPLSERSDDLAFPPGAWQGALGPSSLSPGPETPAEREARELEQRLMARERADTAERMGEEARRLKAGPPVGSGPLKGMRT